MHAVTHSTQLQLDQTCCNMYSCSFLLQSRHAVAYTTTPSCYTVVQECCHIFSCSFLLYLVQASSSICSCYFLLQSKYALTYSAAPSSLGQACRKGRQVNAILQRKTLDATRRRITACSRIQFKAKNSPRETREKFAKCRNVQQVCKLQKGAAGVSTGGRSIRFAQGVVGYILQEGLADLHTAGRGSKYSYCIRG